jgi:transcriptional regulator with XRE-family HTH domain
MADMKTFGDRIRNRRKALGLTQADLAKKVRVLNTSVCRWETGQCPPELRRLPALAKALGITVADLF